MSALRFEFTCPDGRSIAGPVRGNGGLLSSPARLEAAVRNARDGRSHGLYEPSHGCVAVYPDYSAAGDGEPVIVDLRETSWRVLRGLTPDAVDAMGRYAADKFGAP